MKKSYEILFDAQDGKFPPFNFESAALFLIILFLVANILKNPKIKNDYFRKSIFIFSILLSFLFATLSFIPFFISFPAKYIVNQGYEKNIYGCVSNYLRVVHENSHYMSDTYFNLEGQTFHFNSIPWLPGFHPSEGTIYNGEKIHLLAFHNMIIKLEVLNDARGCN